MKKSRRKWPLEFKKRMVGQYLSGERTAQEIAAEHDLDTAHIYTWKTQLERLEKAERIGELESTGMSPDEARRMQELEEELEAYKRKVAEQSVVIDLLKKLHPNYQSEKRSSGFIETKRRLGQKRGQRK